MYCTYAAQVDVQGEVPEQKLSHCPSMAARGCVYGGVVRDVVTRAGVPEGAISAARSHSASSPYGDGARPVLRVAQGEGCLRLTPRLGHHRSWSSSPHRERGYDRKVSGGVLT